MIFLISSQIRFGSSLALKNDLHDQFANHFPFIFVLENDVCDQFATHCRFIFHKISLVTHVGA